MPGDKSVSAPVRPPGGDPPPPPRPAVHRPPPPPPPRPAAAGRPSAAGGARRWIEYRPRPRPGACLADLDRAAHKAAHRLLASALSPHAFAQAVSIMALEE